MKAIVCMNICAIASAAVGVMWKVLSAQKVEIFEFLLTRSVMNATIFAGMIRLNGMSPLKDTNKQVNWLYARAIAGQTSFCMFLLATSLLPLSLNMIIYQTSPFWTSILALWINGEPIYKFEYAAMALCFAGVIGIAMGRQVVGETADFFGVIVSLIMAWVYAACNVINRKLK